MSTLHASDIHEHISWRATLPRLGVPDDYLTGKHGPCPGGHGTDCFRFDNKEGRGTFICSKGTGKHGGPLSGDGFALLMHVHGWDFSIALERVLDAAGLGNGNKSFHSSGSQAVGRQNSTIVGCPVNHPLDWSNPAKSIYRRTLPLAGTIGETYIVQHRGCRLPPSDSHLRFLPATDKYPPSLCALVTDAQTGAPISLHFTRLASDGHGKAGTGRDKVLLAGHRKRGGCIRLFPNEAVTYGLGIAEGIESALALAHAFQPVWSAIDAGNLASFPVLAGIESLVIAADHDDAGLKAAAQLGRRWADAGREVLIATPDTKGFDIANLVVAA